MPSKSPPEEVTIASPPKNAVEESTSAELLSVKSRETTTDSARLSVTSIVWFAGTSKENTSFASTPSMQPVYVAVTLVPSGAVTLASSDGASPPSPASSLPFGWRSSHESPTNITPEDQR